jgi:hypothetical protein
MNNLGWVTFIILLILWLTGTFSSHTFGGHIHVLLIIAFVIVLIRLLSGRTGFL